MNPYYTNIVLTIADFCWSVIFHGLLWEAYALQVIFQYTFSTNMRWLLLRYCGENRRAIDRSNVIDENQGLNVDFYNDRTTGGNWNFIRNITLNLKSRGRAYLHTNAVSAIIVRVFGSIFSTLNVNKLHTVSIIDNSKITMK